MLESHDPAQKAKAEAGGLQVQGPPRRQIEFKKRPGNICLKKKGKRGPDITAVENLASVLTGGPRLIPRTT